MTSSSVLPRRNYGARLEIPDRILHGAGQSADAFAVYLDLCRPQASLPRLYMTYVGANAPPEKTRSWAQNLAAALDRWPDHPLMPQIGLSMTRDGTPELHYEHDVAAGRHDESLKVLFGEMNRLGRPYFVRIGYECNGPWNGYEPRAYADAFAHVTTLLRQEGGNAATVWCVEPWEMEGVYDWCPPDDCADWWSVDWFDPEHFSASAPYLEEADRRGKPVMIGESSPRRLGTTEATARWKLWYEPFFRTMKTSPGIKAFCYINWNWSEYPMWSDWGDSRLEADPELARRWLAEIADPGFAHL